MRSALPGVARLALAAVLNVLLILPASADPKKAKKIEGQIVRVESGLCVVKTRTNEQFTFHVHPKTKFLLKEKAVQFTDLRVGVNVSVDMVVEGNRHFADSVVIVDEVAAGSLIEGEIIRVVGTEQVVVRTLERKEVIVFVDPQTRFLIEDRAGRFADLRSGVNIRVDVNVRDGRHTAKQFVVPSKKKK